MTSRVSRKVSIFAIWVLVAVSWALSASAAPTGLDMLSLMTAREQRKTGVARLTPRQKAELNKWILSISEALAQEELKIFQKRQNSQGADLAAVPSPITDLAQLEGAVLISDDGKMLGKISSNAFDSSSLLNEFGEFGNKFNSDSIFNEFGPYGNKFSTFSPFNEFTTTPPKIILHGKMVAYLSDNKAISPRLATSQLVGWLAENK